MRSRRIIDDKLRFHGSVRHYHRVANSADKNWDQWIDGASYKKAKSRNWPQILIVAAAVLALLGVIIGLIIELG